MARLLESAAQNPNFPLIYNVDGVVGSAPATNNTEDVSLVQFLFTKIATSTDPKVTADMKAVFAKVKVTGTIDQATIAAILSLQAAKKAVTPGTVVDGRVSPAKVGYSYGTGFWTIVNLNALVIKMHPDQWPRLDKIAGCPATVAAMAKRTCVGA